MPLEIGQKVPDVEFTQHDGSAVRLASLLGQKTVVLYFYPKDDSPGCTIEACAFRDSYEDFTQAGAIVVGVSADSAADHEAFKTKHKLPFTLLTDQSGAAAKGLGVKKVLGFMPGRVTFVIDRNGVLRSRFDSAIRMKEHVNSALELVKSLESKPAA
jgi:peroxiredoxin Q/BCP